MLDTEPSATPRDGTSDSRPSLLVWVIAPVVETDDPNQITYYNDYRHGRAPSIRRRSASWRASGEWEPVTLRTYRDVIDRIATESDGHFPVVFNLCDGDEINGSPGSR